MQITLNNGKVIGDDASPYVIAEVGINHNGDFGLARTMISAAAATGVDAVKFQKRTLEAMYTKDFLDRPYTKHYSFGATYGDHKRFLEFSDDQFIELRHCTEAAGVDFIVSGFDAVSFDFIEKHLNVSIHKIASPFITHYPLLEQVASYGKPVIVSTGMHTWDEIKAAVEHIRKINNQIILLQATTLYPCPDEKVNLSAIRKFRNELDILVGYSSHDKGVVIAAASVAMGACVIEKHFTTDRTMIGPDHAASVEPRGLELIVKYSHALKKAVGNGEKDMQEGEDEARIKYGVSIVAAREIKKGRVISSDDITVKCPGGGISPAMFRETIGRRSARNIAEDTIIYPDDIE